VVVVSSITPDGVLTILITSVVASVPKTDMVKVVPSVNVACSGESVVVWGEEEAVVREVGAEEDSSVETGTFVVVTRLPDSVSIIIVAEKGSLEVVVKR